MLQFDISLDENPVFYLPFSHLQKYFVFAKHYRTLPFHWCRVCAFYLFKMSHEISCLIQNVHAIIILLDWLYVIESLQESLLIYSNTDYDNDHDDDNHGDGSHAELNRCRNQGLGDLLCAVVLFDILSISCHYTKPLPCYSWQMGQNWTEMGVMLALNIIMQNNLVKSRLEGLFLCSKLHCWCLVIVVADECSHSKSRYNDEFLTHRVRGKMAAI